MSDISKDPVLRGIIEKQRSAARGVIYRANGEGVRAAYILPDTGSPSGFVADPMGINPGGPDTARLIYQVRIPAGVSTTTAWSSGVVEPNDGSAYGFTQKHSVYLGRDLVISYVNPELIDNRVTPAPVDPVTGLPTGVRFVDADFYYYPQANVGRECRAYIAKGVERGKAEGLVAVSRMEKPDAVGDAGMLADHGMDTTTVGGKNVGVQVVLGALYGSDPGDAEDVDDEDSPNAYGQTFNGVVDDDPDSVALTSYRPYCASVIKGAWHHGFAVKHDTVDASAFIYWRNWAVRAVGYAGRTTASFAYGLDAADIGYVHHHQFDVGVAEKVEYTGPGASPYTLAVTDYFGATSVGVTTVQMGEERWDVTDPTRNHEYAARTIATVQDGDLADRLAIGGGLYTTGAAGGDKGPDTANLKALYIDGVLELGVDPAAAAAVTPIGVTQKPKELMAKASAPLDRRLRSINVYINAGSDNATAAKTAGKLASAAARYGQKIKVPLDASDGLSGAVDYYVYFATVTRDLVEGALTLIGHAVFRGAVGADIESGAVAGAHLATGAVDLAGTKVTGKDLANVDPARAGKLDGVETGATKSRVLIQSGAPTSPTTNDVWVDTTKTPPLTKVWNGAAWKKGGAEVTRAPSAPTSPDTGDIWIDTSITPKVTKAWDGSAWEIVGRNTTTTLHLSDAGLLSRKNKAAAGVDITDEGGNVLGNNELVNSLASFAPRKRWSFKNSLQGFTVANATSSTGPLFVNLIGAANNQMTLLLTGLSYVGADTYKVRCKLRPKQALTSGQWSGRCMWSTAGHGFVSASFRKSLPLPGNWAVDEWRVLEWDMSAPTVGGTDWLDNVITGLVVDFTQVTGLAFDVAWIAIGDDNADAVALKGVEDGADITAVHDARGALVDNSAPTANSNPSVYRAMGVVTRRELKQASSLSVSGSGDSSAILETHVPSSSTSMVIKQRFIADDGTWKRKSTSESAWGAWKRIFDEDQKPRLGVGGDLLASDGVTPVADNDALNTKAHSHDGYNRNPTFQRWSGAAPDNFTVQGAPAVSKATTASRYGDWGLQAAYPASADQWLIATASGASEVCLPPDAADYYVIEYEVTLAAASSGAADGFKRAGIWWRVIYQNSSNYKGFALSLFDEHSSPTIGRTYTGAKVIANNSGAGSPAGVPTDVWFYLAGNSIIFTGGSDTAKTLIWHRVNVRKATRQEIRAEKGLDDNGQVDTVTGLKNKSLANLDSTASGKLGGIAAGADVTAANYAKGSNLNLLGVGSDFAPSVYRSMGAITICEQKNRTAIGAPGAAVNGELVTKVTQAATGTGTVHQQFTSADGVFKRRNSSESAWTPWKKGFDQENVPDLSAGEVSGAGLLARLDPSDIFDVTPINSTGGAITLTYGVSKPSLNVKTTGAYTVTLAGGTGGDRFEITNNENSTANISVIADRTYTLGPGQEGVFIYQAGGTPGFTLRACRALCDNTKFKLPKYMMSTGMTTFSGDSASSAAWGADGAYIVVDAASWTGNHNLNLGGGGVAQPGDPFYIEFKNAGSRTLTVKDSGVSTIGVCTAASPTLMVRYNGSAFVAALI